MLYQKQRQQKQNQMPIDTDHKTECKPEVKGTKFTVLE